MQQIRCRDEQKPDVDTTVDPLLVFKLF